MCFALLVINWPNLFLVCLIVGLSLSAISLLMGMFHMDLHLPHHMEHFLHFHHVHMGNGHVHGGAVHTGAGGGAQTNAAVEISPINLSTIMAFLAWFGGVGYLLTGVYRVWFVPALGIATVAGLFGGAIVFWFIAKVLLTHEQPMDPMEARVIGAVGTLTLGIREGGTGELVYVQGGTRKTAAARSADGKPIARGTEVAVTSFERGVAYVRPWDELTGDATPSDDHKVQPS